MITVRSVTVTMISMSVRPRAEELEVSSSSLKHARLPRLVPLRGTQPRHSESRGRFPRERQAKAERWGGSGSLRRVIRVGQWPDEEEELRPKATKLATVIAPAAEERKTWRPPPTAPLVWKGQRKERRISLRLGWSWRATNSSGPRGIRGREGGGDDSGRGEIEPIVRDGEDANSAEGITSTETRYLKEKSWRSGWSLGPQPAR